VFKCLKSAHQVPNNGILEEVTRGSMTIVAKQSLEVAIRFISDWSRNLEVVPTKKSLSGYSGRKKSLLGVNVLSSDLRTSLFFKRVAMLGPNIEINL
jgi:hypothetical protein